MRRQPTRALSNEALLEELRRLAASKGSAVVTAADVDASERLAANVLLTRFGSFAAAVEAAGLKQSPMANWWTARDYLDNLRAVAEHVQREPILDDMNRPPSRITSGSYLYRFGSWENAIAAALA
jgi:Homing endonuclease associated repeat